MKQKNKIVLSIVSSFGCIILGIIVINYKANAQLFSHRSHPNVATVGISISSSRKSNIPQKGQSNTDNLDNQTTVRNNQTRTIDHSDNAAKGIETFIPLSVPFSNLAIVILTTVLAIATWRYMKHAGQTVEEMKLAAKAEMRPAIVLKDRLPRRSHMWSVENIGKGSALNVHFIFEGMEGHLSEIEQNMASEDSLAKSLHETSSIKYHFSPGQRMELRIIEPCIINYEDLAGRKYTTEFRNGENKLSSHTS